MTYRTHHFELHELVDPETFHGLGERSWQLLDDRALVTLDELRDEFGPIVVNNWHSGGERRFSGYRPESCKVGAAHSQHRYGRAFDCVFLKVSADEVREYVMSAYQAFPYLTTVEVPTPNLPMSWFHFDVRNAEAILKVPRT